MVCERQAKAYCAVAVDQRCPPIRRWALIEVKHYQAQLSSWCLFSPAFSIRVVFIRWCKKVLELNPNDFSVPLCSIYCAHRMGELCMLMLGETVLSLISVGVQKERWYIMFVAGIFIAGNLQFQYYLFVPKDPTNSAIKSNLRGTMYSLCTVFTGAAL
jgi:hypothetical protein